ncbi:hypothetical protein K449DRAFT_419878 [Hypoxylon sp. EC38]|nr:hypothetical protein K449DRAFT_419878 [Hypoxylon sp. EC38]
MDCIIAIHKFLTHKMRGLLDKLWKMLGKAEVRDEDIRCIFSHSTVMYQARSAAAEATEDDEWGPKYAENWNPANEARQARKLEAWKASQLREPVRSNSAEVERDSTFRPYQDPRGSFSW